MVWGSSLLGNFRHLYGQWVTSNERQSVMVDVATNFVLGEMGEENSLEAGKMSLGIVDDVVQSGGNL